MNKLSEEIAAYKKMQRELELDYSGKWVIICGSKLIDVHESFESAAADAVKKFGSGPYLIREVGASPVPYPASVLYRPVLENV
ncbi:MAG: hypothetical protein OXD44_01550 [Gammaproteobacteria bacterium]|nr:hypothetical protein [Gammaproteobacteria bacterium]